MKRTVSFILVLTVGGLLGWLAALERLNDALGQVPEANAPATKGTPTALPRPDFEFKGKVGKTYKESDPPRFPQPVKAPKDAPNVVVILLDDTGFGQYSTFGGGVPSPTLDKLAAEGLKFNRFHTTALCSPSRAALITGRNHHSAATGVITEAATGYDGYTCVLPRGCGTIGEVLRQNGYATAWIGKNHNTPAWETSAAGPFDRWANGLGFDYFYGFNAGDMNHWDPLLFEFQFTDKISSEHDMLAAQPAVTDALEMAEDPVAVLGEYREFSTILEWLVERRFVLFADPLAGNGFVRNDAMPRPGDVGMGQAGIETQDGGDQDEYGAGPVHARQTEKQGRACRQGRHQKTRERCISLLGIRQPAAPEQHVSPPRRRRFGQAAWGDRECLPQIRLEIRVARAVPFGLAKCRDRPAVFPRPKIRVPEVVVDRSVAKPVGEERFQEGGRLAVFSRSLRGIEDLERAHKRAFTCPRLRREGSRRQDVDHQCDQGSNDSTHQSPTPFQVAS